MDFMFAFLWRIDCMGVVKRPFNKLHFRLTQFFLVFVHYTQLLVLLSCSKSISISFYYTFSTRHFFCLLQIEFPLSSFNKHSFVTLPFMTSMENCVTITDYSFWSALEIKALYCYAMTGKQNKARWLLRRRMKKKSFAMYKMHILEFIFNIFLAL